MLHMGTQLGATTWQGGGDSQADTTAASQHQDGGGGRNQALQDLHTAGHGHPCDSSQ